MLRYFIVGILVTGWGLNNLSAQLADKLVPHMGFMYEIITFQEVGSSSPPFSSAYYTFHLGTYYTLAHSNDIISAGVDGSVNFGINFPTTRDRGTVVTLTTQVPVFLMGRLGANATSYNEQKIGIGAGVGLVYTYFSDVADILTGSKVNAGFFVPAAVVEGSLRSRGGPITARVHFSLSDRTTDLNFSGGAAPFKLGNWGIGLIYGF